MHEGDTEERPSPPEEQQEEYPAGAEAPTEPPSPPEHPEEEGEQPGLSEDPPRVD